MEGHSILHRAKAPSTRGTTNTLQKPTCLLSHVLTHSGCTHGRQQKLNGDKQGDEKREKRHFQLECNLSDFLLLFTIGRQLPDVPLQHLSCLLLLHFSFHAPLQRRALPYLEVAFRSSPCRLLFKVPTGGQQWSNVRE